MNARLLILARNTLTEQRQRRRDLPLIRQHRAEDRPRLREPARLLVLLDGRLLAQLGDQTVRLGHRLLADRRAGGLLGQQYHRPRRNIVARRERLRGLGCLAQRDLRARRVELE